MFGENLGQLDRAAVVARAEEGQRLLMVVQLMEQEAQGSVDRFVAAWSN